MDTVTLEDVRNEVGTSLTAAIDAIDWKSRLALPEEPTAPMAQDLPALPEAFAKLGDWATARGDKPLEDGEVLRFNADEVEVIPGEQFARMAQGGAVAGFVDDLDGLGGRRVDIPFGSVAFGALPGALTGEIIDAVMPFRRADGSINPGNTITKGLVGVGAAMFLDQAVGRRAAGFFVGSLLLQTFTDFVSFQGVVDWVTRQIRRNQTGTAGQIIGKVAQGDVPIVQGTGRNRVLEDLRAA